MSTDTSASINQVIYSNNCFNFDYELFLIADENLKILR